VRLSILNLGLAAALAGFIGCNGGGGGGGGGSSNIGDNNAGVFVALGDSITNGRCVPAGAPYPDRTAAISGKTVVNQGICGERSGGGAARVSGVLSRYKPEGLLILYGANDVIHGADLDGTIENLRAIIQTAKANMTRPIIATLMPMYDGHAQFQGAAKELSRRIRQLASQEGAKLVNLEGEFGQERDLLQPDGLHPSDMGTQVIGFAFADKL
jgi:lysophospholipase L1-like esterase